MVLYMPQQYHPLPLHITLLSRPGLLHERRQMPREVPSETDSVVWVRELRLAISAVTPIDNKQGFLALSNNLRHQT